ncbi:MAG: histidine kinase [Spirochaetales bacterium]|nr:histidine kinase [Spirochaetales bacterium]
MAELNKNSRSLSKGLRNHLILIICLSAIFWVILNLYFNSTLNRPLFIFLSAALLSAYIWCVASIVIHIYRPIKKIEAATLLLSEGDNNIFQGLEIESDSVQLSMYFHELVHLLKESIDREYTAEFLIKEAELKALQSQINPHFLYNVLDGIRGHALTEGVTELAEMTEALSMIFRYSVSHWENEVTLERELVNVKSYFKIQQYRFNNKFDLKICIEDDEDQTLVCTLPKLTLQPIIENAIYHGLEMKLGKGLVTIRTKLTDELLIIEISDDGVGLSQNNLDQINDSFYDWKTVKTEKDKAGGSGIALTNVNSRIKMIFGEEFGLHMYSTEGFGAMIEILLPRHDKNSDDG